MSAVADANAQGEEEYAPVSRDDLKGDQGDAQGGEKEGEGNPKGAKKEREKGEKGKEKEKAAGSGGITVRAAKLSIMI